MRKYSPAPIEEADLLRIVDAGRRAPSSRNEQRWDFVVCTDREQLRGLAQVWRGAWHVADSAVTVALLAPVTPDTETRESIEYDLGHVTMSMMVAAADLGIGSAHAAVIDQDLARRILGHPTDRRCAWLISFGYPADRSLTPIALPKRRSMEEVVHRNRW